MGFRGRIAFILPVVIVILKEPNPSLRGFATEGSHGLFAFIITASSKSILSPRRIGEVKDLKEYAQSLQKVCEASRLRDPMYHPEIRRHPAFLVHPHRCFNIFNIELEITSTPEFIHFYGIADIKWFPAPDMFVMICQAESNCRERFTS